MAAVKRLIELLKRDSRFVDADGELVVAAVQDCARNSDPRLVQLLLSDGAAKSKFFAKIDGHWVFNTHLFVNYIAKKNFLDNSHTRFRNRIGLTIADDRYLAATGEVSLAWPYKDCVLEGGQTKEQEKRREIFFNEVLAEDEINRLLSPKVLTGFVRQTARGGGAVKKFARDKKGVLRENMIIQGNNLLALHTICDQFRGRVKMIYIDPPYNTGGNANIFTYNNNFNHSAWLVFMKNRLEAARELLTNDGFIAIAIDHAELFYLGVLADEIFGRDNRLGVVTIVHNPKGRNLAKFFSGNSDYMLVYAKTKELAQFNRVALDDEAQDLFDLSDTSGQYRLDPFMRVRHDSTKAKKPKFFYPIYVSPDLGELTLAPMKGYTKVLPINGQGKEHSWKTLPATFECRNKSGEFVAKRDNGEVVIYNKYRENQVIKNTWVHKRYQSEFQGTNLLKKLLGKNLFPYPKSIYTVKDTVKLMAGKNDIVMDFFAGSGTTAHAVLALNKDDGGDRKFILVEQLEEHADICRKRVQKVLAADDSKESFVCCELAPYNESFIKKIQAAKSSESLLKIWREIAENSFLNWYVNRDIPENAERDFAAVGKDKGLDAQKRLLCCLLDKNQLYVNLSEMDDSRYNIGKADKRLNRDFQGGNDGR